MAKGISRRKTIKTMRIRLGFGLCCLISSATSTSISHVVGFHTIAEFPQRKKFFWKLFRRRRFTLRRTQRFSSFLRCYFVVFDCFCLFTCRWRRSTVDPRVSLKSFCVLNYFASISCAAPRQVWSNNRFITSMTLWVRCSPNHD